MKKPKIGNQYFTKDHEEAIVAYALSTNKNDRTKLYIDWIEPAFNEMVDKITYTYRFTTLPNIDGLKEECKIWLTTILGKFDPAKGSKAFSYFSVITKNWFIHKTKKNSQKNRREIDFSEIPKDLEAEYLSTRDCYTSKREDDEFWSFLMAEIDDWDDKDLKEGEQKVLDAIKILLSNIEEIEIFNKKAIYLYIREITGMNTKQVVNNLNKLRERYRNWRSKWNSGSI